MESIPVGAGPGGQSNEEAAAKKEQEEQMRRDMMSTVLDTAARERCMCLFPSPFRDQKG